VVADTHIEKMAFPVNHKTVFVLDHGPNFGMPSEVVRGCF